MAGVQALDRHLGTADEALLSTAFSWMRKAADDKQDGMRLLPSSHPVCPASCSSKPSFLQT